MKTILGLFDTMEEAKKAALDLEAAGVPHRDISFAANNENAQYAPHTTPASTPAGSINTIGHDAVVGAEIGGVAGLLLGLTGLMIPGLGWIATAGWLGGMLLGAGTGAVIGGLAGALTQVGVPAEDAAHYTEAVRRGGTLVAVRSEDNLAQRVAEILGNDGAVNVHERVEQYKKEGYVPSMTPAVPAASTVSAAATASTATPQPRTVTGETVLPVIEEELQVGKREVERGGVRVYSHVTETPVSEQVTLREEHVNVERHAVNRPVTNADLSALKDETLEVRTTAEEAVVAKQARIVEEVVVGKEATERTETVSDTVRRTDVEVEEIPGRTTTTGTVGSTVGAAATNAARSVEGNIPGVQTGGHAVDGTPDTRGILEKAADALTGDRTDDKTGKAV